MRDARTVTREDLYERVWTLPMRRLAAEFGISDVGLAKVCKRLNVPVPGRGYWAQVEAGAAGPRKPLPKIALRTATVIRSIPPETDEERRERETHEALVAHFSGLRVAEVLENPHRLTIRTKRRFEVIEQQLTKPRRKNAGDLGAALREHLLVDNGRYVCRASEGFSATFSLAVVPRGLLFVDALAKALEAEDFRLQVNSERRSLEATKQGEGVGFRIWESYSRREVAAAEVEKRRSAGEWARDFEYVGNGRLVLEISGREWGTSKTWRDGKKDKLENHLADIVAAFVELVPLQTRLREDRARKEAERQERERVNAQKRWREAEERREFEELIAESAKSDTLLRLARYLDEVEKSAKEEAGELPAASAAWLAKMRARLAASDPFGQRVALLAHPPATDAP